MKHGIALGIGAARLALVLVGTALTSSPAAAQEHEHEHHPGGEHHHEGLHLSHPMVTESVSPDTKLRLDFARADPHGEREMELEGEYAFTRSFSIEAGLPFDLGESSLGEADVSLKFAHYRWEERGLLVGGGVSLGFPLEAEHEAAGATGETGTTQVGLFLNAGLRTGSWEMVGATQLGLSPGDGERAARLGWNGSALYHLTPRVETMLEYRGEGDVRGPVNSGRTHALAPGLKVRPLEASSLTLGASVLVPVAGEHEYDTRLLLSAFYHF